MNQELIPGTWYKFRPYYGGYKHLVWYAKCKEDWSSGWECSAYIGVYSGPKPETVVGRLGNFNKDGCISLKNNEILWAEETIKTGIYTTPPSPEPNFTNSEFNELLCTKYKLLTKQIN